MMSKFHKIFVSMFVFMLIAGFSALKAQTPMNVQVEPVKGETSAYTLTISPMSPAVNAALTEISNQGRLIHVVSVNAQTGVCKVTSIYSQTTAESIKNYVLAYLNSKTKPSTQPETR